jgi:hypothetical protein
MKGAQLARDALRRVTRHARRQRSAKLGTSRRVVEQAQYSPSQRFGAERRLVGHFDCAQPRKCLRVGPLM